MVGLPRLTLNLRSACGSELLMIGTVNVRVAMPTPNVSVPVVAV